MAMNLLDDLNKYNHIMMAKNLGVRFNAQDFTFEELLIYSDIYQESNKETGDGK